MGKLARALADRLMSGTEAPGGGRHFHESDSTGYAFTVVARGDVFEVYGGRRTIVALTLDTPTMLRFAWWVVRWWIAASWCGLRMRLWRAAMRRQ